VSLTCFEHPSVHPQEIVVFIWMHERNAIKLYVQDN